MSHPSPPESPGSAGPYGQQPQHGGWQQSRPPGQAPVQGNAPPPVPPVPPAPPGPVGLPGANGGPGPGIPHGFPGQPGPGTVGMAPGTPAMAPGMAPGMPQPPLPLPPKKNTGRTCLSAFLGVVGGLALLGGAALTAHTFSNAAQKVPNRSAYGPTMWRNLPAEKLFPKTLGPKMNSQSGASDPKHAEWHRVGISQRTGCADSLTGTTLAEAEEKGCKAVLRATYVDPTGNVLGTVGLIVLPGTDSAEDGMSTFFDAEKEKRNPKPGVKAMGVPHTVAARFKDSNRNGGEGVQATILDLPYAYVATTGSADGRRAGHLPGKWGRTSLDAKSDRGPWREAAESLANDLNLYHGDLLLEETS